MAIELSEEFPIPNIHLSGDEPLLEPWMFDTLLSSTTLHIRDKAHMLLSSDGTIGCDGWGNFFELPQDSVLPTGMKLVQQTLDNFYWDHCHDDVPATFQSDEPDKGFAPNEYLSRLFEDESLCEEAEYRHGGYLRVNGVRAGDLRMLRKWVQRIQTEDDATLFAGEDLGRELREQVVECHGVRMRAKDVAIRWCLWCIRYGTLFRLRHQISEGTDEAPGRRADVPSEVQGWLGSKPPRKSTGGKAPRKQLAVPKKRAAATSEASGSGDAHDGRSQAARVSKRKR